MKIIGLLGSPRGDKSETRRLAVGFGEGAQAAGAEVELVDICTLKIDYCRACEVCHRTGACVHTDDYAGRSKMLLQGQDMTSLRKRMLHANGILLASPAYFGSVTAQMKTLIDRMSDLVHCQLLRGKYGASLSTAGGPDSEDVVTYMNDLLVGMGAFAIGGVAASVGRGAEEMAAAVEKARQLGGDLCAAIEEQRIIPEQQKRHDEMAKYFRELVETKKDLWLHEHGYWNSFA